MLKIELPTSELVNPKIKSLPCNDNGISIEKVFIGFVNIVFKISCGYVLAFPISVSVSVFFVSGSRKSSGTFLVKMYLSSIFHLNFCSY